MVQVGKTADFATASNMATVIERRISDAFGAASPSSERTTAEEVRSTQTRTATGWTLLVDLGVRPT